MLPLLHNLNKSALMVSDFPMQQDTSINVLANHPEFRKLIGVTKLSSIQMIKFYIPETKRLYMMF